ncbi:MAG: lactate racemase domain-containing protein [Pirellulales bacterium]
MENSDQLPRFFRLKQTFPKTVVRDIPATVFDQLSKVCVDDLAGKSIAITVGSRGIANLAIIVKACVDYFKSRGARPKLVPAMGSHGGGTAEGQKGLLASFGVTEQSMGCPIESSMEVIEVTQAKEGFPVYFDRAASEADFVLVLNRIKPHTRFVGAIESGLMKMMLIGLGKQKGAEVYHRVISNYSFDQIVRSVAQTVVSRCRILAGLAILENAYEETASLVGVRAGEIESTEPTLLAQVKAWMPKLPFDQAELLIVDQIGKNISGTGMDTNIIGRKYNDIAAINGDKPNIHHIYIRSLTEETHGNASGIGLAQLCHRRVVEAIDREVTRNNCITACHVSAGAIPLDFANDRSALRVACVMAGYIQPAQLTSMWIHDTLSLDEIECSEAFFEAAKANSQFEILSEPTSLQFDAEGDLLPRF